MSQHNHKPNGQDNQQFHHPNITDSPLFHIKIEDISIDENSSQANRALLPNTSSPLHHYRLSCAEPEVLLVAPNTAQANKLPSQPKVKEYTTKNTQLQANQTIDKYKEVAVLFQESQICFDLSCQDDYEEPIELDMSQHQADSENMTTDEPTRKNSTSENEKSLSRQFKDKGNQQSFDKNKIQQEDLPYYSDQINSQDLDNPFLANFPEQGFPNIRINDASPFSLASNLSLNRRRFRHERLTRNCMELTCHDSRNIDKKKSDPLKSLGIQGKEQLAETGRSYLKNEPTFFVLKPKFQETKGDRDKIQISSQGTKQHENLPKIEKISTISSPEQKQRHLLAKRTRVSLTKPSLKHSQEVKAQKSKFLSKRAQKLLNSTKHPITESVEVYQCREKLSRPVVSKRRKMLIPQIPNLKNDTQEPQKCNIKVKNQAEDQKIEVSRQDNEATETIKNDSKEVLLRMFKLWPIFRGSRMFESHPEHQKSEAVVQVEDNNEVCRVHIGELNSMSQATHEIAIQANGYAPQTTTEYNQFLLIEGDEEESEPQELSFAMEEEHDGVSSLSSSALERRQNNYQSSSNDRP